MGKAYTWRCAVIAASGTCLYGYDSSIIASTFAQEGFQTYFKPSAKILGAIGSCYFAGVLLGQMIVRLITDRFGRKYTLLLGGLVGLIGAVFQTAAHEVGLFLAGRIVAGISSAMLLTTVAIYQSEIAPPQIRGRMVAFQNMSLCIAGLLAAIVGLAGNYSSNLSLQWRLPIAFQIVPAVAMITGVWFLPFSPRWLVMKGRNDEARAVLQRLHDDNENHLFWEQEYQQILAQVQREMEEKRQESWTHVFKNKSDRMRLFLAICAITATQTSGAAVIQVFQAVFYGGLGFSTRKILVMGIVFQISLLIGGVLNMFTIDWFGRRFLFLSGLAVMTVVLAMFAAFSERFTSTGNSAWGNAGVAMVMIFIFIYGCTYLSTQFAFAAEVLPTKMRSLGMVISIFIGWSITLCLSQTAPIALENIGWKFNFVFIACNCFFFVIFWFFLPETKGLTLEEIGRLFGAEVVVEIDQEINEAEKMEAEQVEVGPTKGDTAQV